MSMTLLTAPSVEPLTWAEVKAFLRLDSDAEQSLGNTFIMTARQLVENYTGRALISQRWRMSLDAWPRPVQQSSYSTTACVVNMFTQRVFLPKIPVLAVESVKVFAANGTSVTIPATAYSVDLISGKLAFLESAVLVDPSKSVGGIEIDFSAGYGTSASSIPMPLKQAMLVLVALSFEERIPEQAMFPAAVAALLKPYRFAKISGHL
jgi:uncharacterized phiE125 gp8 family phage protein